MRLTEIILCVLFMFTMCCFDHCDIANAKLAKGDQSISDNCQQLLGNPVFETVSAVLMPLYRTFVDADTREANRAHFSTMSPESIFQCAVTCSLCLGAFIAALAIFVLFWRNEAVFSISGNLLMIYFTIKVFYSYLSAPIKLLSGFK
jgi:hypothetical protein